MPTRLAITRVSLIINFLAKFCVPISSDLIAEAYEVSLQVTGDTAAGVRSLARADVGAEILRVLGTATV